MQDSKLDDYVVDVQQRIWAYKNHNNRFANYIGISSKHRLRIKNDLVAKTNAFTSWKAHDAELCTRWVMTCVLVSVYGHAIFIYSISMISLIESFLLKAFNSLNHNFHILYGCENKLHMRFYSANIFGYAQNHENVSLSSSNKFIYV